MTATPIPRPTPAQLARLMGDFSTERRPLTKIHRYPENPRRNKQAVAKVAASLLANGWRQPIVVDAAGVIVVGDTRYLAALALKLKSAPVHVAIDLTPEEVTAYRIMDNRSAEEAEWDYGRLALQVQGLQALDYDLGLTGFDAPELAQLPDLAAEQRLADLAAGGDDAPPSGPAHPGRTASGLVTLSIPMTADQRSTILAACAHAKSVDKLELTADALYLICDQWRKSV